MIGSGADFAYGNTRLRARWRTLLSEEALERLAHEDVDGQLAALAAATPYSSDVESALARARGLRAALLAVRSHLVRTLNELPALYEGRARDLVEVDLAGWDLHNVLLLLRGAALGRPAAAVLDEHVPVGAFTTDVVGELAGQSDPDRVVALLVAWRVPDPETAATVAAGWPEFERTGDLPALELRVVIAHERRRARRSPSERWTSCRS